MKLFTKTAVILLVIALSAFAFAGCASEATPPVNAEASESVQSDSGADTNAGGMATEVKKIGLSMFTQKKPVLQSDAGRNYGLLRRAGY